jgi:hypothetical protein
MSHKKNQTENDADVTETRQEKFIRIAGKRAKVLGKAYVLLTRLPKQPTYEITQENAQKMITYVNAFHDAFIERYAPLANGETKSISQENIVGEVF